MKNELPSLYLGPMSKNVVDAALQYEREQPGKIGFIPSRRQVDYKGGYVNNWTTQQFSEYVSSRIPIQRDHGGPAQGYKQDDGYNSYSVDAKFLDAVHIDPWKHTQVYQEGLQHTIEAIRHMNLINPLLTYEVGTEEAILPFTPHDLEKLLQDLQEQLSRELFKKIRYAVVQSGVGLDLANRNNTGTFSREKLVSMVKVCKKYNILSKEHNGDYLRAGEVRERFKLGLNAINIAPELGQIETRCYIDKMGNDQLEEYYNICYRSKRWEKWVSSGFIPEKNKIKLIEICGHYVFSQKEFLKIKPNIDQEIHEKVKNRISEIIDEG